MKNLLILAVLLFSLGTITAQDTKSFPEKEFSLFVGPALTNIKNDNLLNDKYASTKGNVWFNLGFNYCKYFNKNAGLILGLEYSMYKNVTTYAGAYRSSDLSVDRDGYIYYAVSEANYKDTRTVQAGEVPIGLRLQVPVNDKVQFYVDLGLRLNFIASAKIEQKGTLETKGAYPTKYTSLFIYDEKDAYYGFTSKTYNSKIDIPVGRVNLGCFIGAGVKAKISDDTFILINPCYIKGLGDITNKNNRGEDYQDIFGNKLTYKKFTLSEFALRIGVGFNL